jgi:hypothetical protein
MSGRRPENQSSRKVQSGSRLSLLSLIEQRALRASCPVSACLVCLSRLSLLGGPCERRVLSGRAATGRGMDEREKHYTFAQQEARKPAGPWGGSIETASRGLEPRVGTERVCCQPATLSTSPPLLHPCSASGPGLRPPACHMHS